MVEPSRKRLTLRKRKGDSSESLPSVEDSLMRDHSHSLSYHKKVRFDNSSGTAAALAQIALKNKSAEAQARPLPFGF